MKSPHNCINYTTLQGETCGRTADTHTTNYAIMQGTYQMLILHISIPREGINNLEHAVVEHATHLFPKIETSKKKISH
jgi:hypothetical protein